MKTKLKKNELNSLLYLSIETSYRELNKSHLSFSATPGITLYCLLSLGVTSGIIKLVKADFC